MDSISGLAAIFLLIVGIALLIFLIFCFWWFSGYLVTTFKWNEIDQNAQIITCIVLLTIGGSGCVRR